MTGYIGEARSVERSPLTLYAVNLSLIFTRQCPFRDGLQEVIENGRRRMREPTRSTHPSSGTGVSVAAAALGDLPPPWCAETFQSCDGGWSLVIMTADAHGLTYFVTEKPGGFSLSELRDDELRSISEHLSLATLISAIRARVAHGTAANRAA